MNALAHFAGWVIVIFVTFLALDVILRVFGVRKEIDLSSLISEPDGKASLSRFQFLIFTFVIAICLFLVIVGDDPPRFPREIPSGIFALLGISGGSFVVSKGIQANRDIEEKKLNAGLEQRRLDAALEQAKLDAAGKASTRRGRRTGEPEESA